MMAIASQITSLTIVYSAVYSGAHQRKHQSSASLAFVQGIHRGPVNSPHKWPVSRKMFPFDDVIMPDIWHHYVIIGLTLRSQWQFSKEGKLSNYLIDSILAICKFLHDVTLLIFHSLYGCGYNHITLTSKWRRKMTETKKWRSTKKCCCE